MAVKINLDSNIQFHHLATKNDMLKISPSSSSINNLNASGDIVFQSLQSSSPLDISNSLLYFYFEIKKVDDKITLENNFFPNLFRSIRLKLGSTDVETINNPGVISTMLNFISTTDNYKKEYGELSGWLPDINNGDLDVKSWDCNLGFYKRKKLYNNTKTFEGYFPLKNLFGFMQNYDRLLYNTMIELICNRQIDDKLLFYGDKDKTGELILKTLELHIPEFRLTPKSELTLLERITTDKPIRVTFLNRLTSKTTLSTGPTFSYKLGNLVYKPRYILIVIKDPTISFEKNNNLFILKSSTTVKAVPPAVDDKITYHYLKSIQIQLNNTYYPINTCELDKHKNKMIFPYMNYINVCKEFLIEPQLSLTEFKNLYPIFCFDVSAQDEKININNIDVTLHITKDSDFVGDLYWCILEEKHIEMKLFNSKVTMIENVRGIDI